LNEIALLIVITSMPVERIRSKKLLMVMSLGFLLFAEDDCKMISISISDDFSKSNSQVIWLDMKFRKMCDEDA
jgi:hypothetical protein